MKKEIYLILISIALLPQFSGRIYAQELKTDICVYGATSAGVIAAYTAAKMGKKVMLVEAGTHLGGLSSGGLGYTDIGNKFAIQRLGLDFYRRLGLHYGKLEQWIFEPGVAKQIFQQYLDEAGLTVSFSMPLQSVEKSGGQITAARFGNDSQNTTRISAAVFIDCSYEGDLMAAAGVPYTVGREDNSLYHEDYNGVQVMRGHQFPDGIDPYKIKGDSTSGLVWGVSTEKLPASGTGDKKVQAYNFRICLTNRPENRLPITKPENYDPERYELLLRFIEKISAKSINEFLKIDLMPNGKTDINNNGPFSTDMIGMNYHYPEANYTQRAEIQRAHEEYIIGLLYFIGHDLRMPEHLRTQMLEWGYPKDEYVENHHWSPQMYVREARRMIGDYVMTQANCVSKEIVTDGIGMAAYTMDSHNCERVVINGMVKNEGNVEIGGFHPYPISYRSLIPGKKDCINLFVPVCLSASHIAYGSIRMEPVFMCLAQTAAVAAVLAIDGRKAVQEVDVKKLQEMLRANPLSTGKTPEVVVDNDDKTGFAITGNWERREKAGYGYSVMISSKKGSEALFTPQIPVSGKYDIYVYCMPAYKNQQNRLSLTLSGGKWKKELTIALTQYQARGQTSGEWIYVGSFALQRGKHTVLSINNNEAEGLVLADAALFKPAW
ncbi:MAG: FAD-dependent oxidoreductase [Agriterribacter sp.]